MRTRLPFIQHRARKMVAEHGTDVILNWVERTGVTTVDPVTGVESGTETPKTATVKALVHAVQIATSGARQFNEVEAGDFILDFVDDITIEGRKGLTFTLPDGQELVAKEVTDRLGRTWDATVQGVKIMRSGLFRKKT